VKDLVVRKNPDFLVREVGDQLKVISLVDGEEFLVEGLAVKLLKKIDGLRAWQQILEAVGNESDISEEDLSNFHNDAQKFFEELIQNKIVIAA
jgi:hypothetical protein